MTSFERCKLGILRDMAGCSTHNAESWCSIMLRNTAGLTDVDQQRLFWNFLQNPEDDDRPPPEVEIFEKHVRADLPKTCVVDVDGKTVVLEQTVVRNGQSVHICLKPVPTDQCDEKQDDEKER